MVLLKNIFLRILSIIRFSNLNKDRHRLIDKVLLSLEECSLVKGIYLFCQGIASEYIRIPLKVNYHILRFLFNVDKANAPPYFLYLISK